MTAHQIYFGALAWPTRDAIGRALAVALERSPDHVRRELLSARRGERALLLDLHGSMPSSWFHALVGPIHELAASAARGRVTMLYDGDGTELSVAVAGGPQGRAPSLDARVTRRWLALDATLMSVAWIGQSTPLDFDVVRRPDGTSALDVRDWMGFYGSLAEREDTIYLETETGEVYEWARPGDAGSTQVLAHPNTELVTVVDVIGPRPLELEGRAPSDCIEIVLQDLFVSGDAHDYLRKDRSWRERGRRSKTIWLAPGAGLLAIRGT